MTTKVYVRVAGKTQAEKFYRCGYQFTRKWETVDVDEATLKRLNEEQMLEVSEEIPADLQGDFEVGADLVEGGETLLAKGDQVLIEGDNATQLTGQASGESTAADDELAAQKDKSADPAAPAAPAKVTPIAAAVKKAKPKAAK